VTAKGAGPKRAKDNGRVNDYYDDDDCWPPSNGNGNTEPHQ
jgi:hypothetical protein